jgi:hypothetical protein
VQDLEKEGMDGGDGIDNALAIDVSESGADLANGSRRQSKADIRLELLKDFGDSKGHPWPAVNDEEPGKSLAFSREPRFCVGQSPAMACGLS